MTKIESDLQKAIKRVRHLKASGRDWEARRREEERMEAKWKQWENDDD